MTSYPVYYLNHYCNKILKTDMKVNSLFASIFSYITVNSVALIVIFSLASRGQRSIPIQITFNMTSRADKLLVVNNSEIMNLLVKILTIISFAALIVFMIGSISHKMIGVETLHSFQLIFLLQALTNNYTPTFGLLKCLSMVLGNFLFISNDKINIYNSKYGTLFNQ